MISCLENSESVTMRSARFMDFFRPVSSIYLVLPRTVSGNVLYTMSCTVTIFFPATFGGTM